MVNRIILRLCLLLLILPISYADDNSSIEEDNRNKIEEAAARKKEEHFQHLDEIKKNDNSVKRAQKEKKAYDSIMMKVQRGEIVLDEEDSNRWKSRLEKAQRILDKHEEMVEKSHQMKREYYEIKNSMKEDL